MARKAVFLDRDGTLIKGTEYLSSPEEVILLPNAAKGIRLFNEKGYLTIIVTNQSGIARGYFTEERLIEIHTRLLEILSGEGARIDAIYYCPHLAEGTVEAYSLDCECRKPGPEMLLRAAREHQIELSGSLMIGDTPADIMAGRSAGCKTVLIQNSHEPFDMPVSPDYIAKDLVEVAFFLS
ncbi:MAG: HAD family hydrolase [Candidatus Brocadiales bacterium]|nr:HAD family hydrolase [Candidatus Brocadiales bacterium]